MRIELSVALCVRNVEREIASMVRRAVALGRAVADDPPPGAETPLAFEVLTLDEGSVDNTLSALSILHGQFAELRSLQDLAPGTAVQHAARLARGRVWLLVDREVDPTLCLWGVRQVMGGHRAAIVEGELLALERDLGQASLRSLPGGLVAAQRAVAAALRSAGQRPARSPPPDRGLSERAHLLLRRRLSRLGLAGFDRPRTSG